MSGRRRNKIKTSPKKKPDADGLAPAHPPGLRGSGADYMRSSESMSERFPPGDKRFKSFRPSIRVPALGSLGDATSSRRRHCSNRGRRTPTVGTPGPRIRYGLDEVGENEMRAFPAR